MNESGEIDLKRIVSGNIKLLLTIPLLVAVGVFVVTNQSQKTYVSVSYLNVNGDVKYAEAIMRSPLVFESAPMKLFFGKELSEVERKEIEAKFKFNTSKLDQRDKPPFVLFEVRDRSPEGAKALANALIDSWLAANKPKGQSRVELERMLAQSREALSVTSNLISQFDSEVKKIIVPNVQYDLAESKVKLHAKRDELKDAIVKIEGNLQGPTRELVIAEPTLPTEPVKNNANVYAILAMISSVLVLLLGLVVRQSFRRK